MFRLRIDRVDGVDSDKIMDICKPNSCVMVLHELPHGNPHYHAYIAYDGEMKENTLRQRIKRGFDNLKRTDFSLKKCDADRVNEYVQYMFNTKHGNQWELIDVRNFDNQLIDDLKKAAKEISDQYVKSVEKKSNKPTVWDLAAEIRERLTKLYEKTVSTLTYLEEPEYQKMYADVLSIAIDVCHKYKQPFEEHYLRRLVITALSQRAAGKQGIIRRIMEKEFRD